jgi:hypothetical protein
MKTRNPVLTTAIACAAMALAALAVALVLGHPRPGIAIAAGLLIGACNPFLASKALGFGGSFSATSLSRLLVLSAAGLGVGLLAGLDVAWLALIGIAAAQLVLAAVATVMLVRR